MALPSTILQRGTRAAQPAATSVAVGVTYYVTDELITEQSNGTIWEPYSASGVGTGDVVGPGSSVDSEVVLFDGTGGVLLQSATGTGIARVTSGVWGTPGNVVESEITLADNTTNNASTSNHGFLKKLSNTSTEFMNGQGNWAVPAGSGGGAVVQVVNTQTGSMTTGTTVIPFDNTIPQNTEGDEYMTLAITPTDAGHTLKIDIVAFVAPNATRWMIGALFQDSTASALASAMIYQPVANAILPFVFSHYMTAGTTSATTFKFRAGSDTASTVTFNGSNAAAFMGGTLASSITITEYVP